MLRRAAKEAGGSEGEAGERILDDKKGTKVKMVPADDEGRDEGEKKRRRKKKEREDDASDDADVHERLKRKKKMGGGGG